MLADQLKSLIAGCGIIIETIQKEIYEGLVQECSDDYITLYEVKLVGKPYRNPERIKSFNFCVVQRFTLIPPFKGEVPGMPQPYFRMPVFASLYPNQLREIHNAPIRYFRLLSPQARSSTSVASSEAPNNENGNSVTPSNIEQPEYCETHMYTHENGNTYFVPVLRRGKTIIPLQTFCHPIESPLTEATENVCCDSTVICKASDTVSTTIENCVDDKEPEMIKTCTSDLAVMIKEDLDPEKKVISSHQSLLNFCSSESNTTVDAVFKDSNINTESNNVIESQLKTIEHVQTKDLYILASKSLPLGMSYLQEHLLPSFQPKRIEAGGSEGTGYVDGIYFQTTEGYFLPSVDISTRRTIQMQFAEQGRLQSEQNLLFARNISDIVFMIIRNFHDPYKKLKNARGVIISTQNEISYDIGINTGLFLNNFGVKLWLYVNQNMGTEESDTPTNSPTDNKLFQLFRSSNELVTEISKLPETNFVLIIMQADCDTELCDKLKTWISTVQAPLFFVDPSVKCQLLTANCHKYAIIPMLPIEGFNEYNYMQTFLCNLSVPENLIKGILPNYKSPFGVNNIVAITKTVKSSNKTSVEHIPTEEPTKLEFETEVKSEN